MKTQFKGLLALSLFLFTVISCTKQEVNEDLKADGISGSAASNSRITTDEIKNLTLVSATVFGTNKNQVQKNAVLGICWSTDNENPTVADNVIFTTAVEGSFSVQMTGLEALSKYYVRTFFASNEVSPGKYANLDYGNVLSFETITNEPVFLTWPQPGRNTVWNNNLGIRWVSPNPGVIETFAAQKIRPGLEVVFKIPNPGGDAWTVGVKKQNTPGQIFDFQTELNADYYIAGININSYNTGIRATTGEWAKIKYVGQTLTIERSTDNGANWQIIATATTFVPTGSYFIGFWSRGGGPNEIYLKLAQ